MSKLAANRAREKSAVQRVALDARYQEDYYKHICQKIEQAVESGNFETKMSVPVEYVEYVLDELRSQGYKCRCVKDSYGPDVHVWWGNQNYLPINLDYTKIGVAIVVVIVSLVFLTIFSKHC